MSETVEFGGWPRPPRWVWVIAGIAGAAVLAGVAVTHTGSHHARASRPPAASHAPGKRAQAQPAPSWPSAAGACGSRAYLPRIHLARRTAGVRARVLVGGTALREVTGGGAVSAPLPGLPDHGGLVTALVAAPGAGYALDVACSSPSALLPVYRIAAGAAHRLDVTADDLLGGPRGAWAVTYRGPRTVLTPLGGGRAVTLGPDTIPVADTAAGLVVAVHHVLSGRPDTVELVNTATGALLRRLGEGSPLGAAGGVVLVSLPDCSVPPARTTCTLEGIDLATGRPTARINLPAGRAAVSAAVLGRDGAEAAFLLARPGLDTRFATGAPVPPADIAVLDLSTGGLDVVPGLELPPVGSPGLAFDATGNWLLVTVSQGSRGELLVWRQGMPGPALLATLPGPFGAAPPLGAEPLLLPAVP